MIFGAGPCDINSLVLDIRLRLLRLLNRPWRDRRVSSRRHEAQNDKPKDEDSQQIPAHDITSVRRPSKDGSLFHFSRHYGDFRHRVNLHPPRVILVLNVSSRDRDVGSHWRQLHSIAVIRRARGDGAWLRGRPVTDDLKHQIPFLIRFVAGAQQVLVLRIDIEPPMRVTILLLPHAIMTPPATRIDDRAGDGETRMKHCQALGVVHMLP